MDNLAQLLRSWLTSNLAVEISHYEISFFFVESKKKKRETG